MVGSILRCLPGDDGTQKIAGHLAALDPLGGLGGNDGDGCKEECRQRREWGSVGDHGFHRRKKSSDCFMGSPAVVRSSGPSAAVGPTSGPFPSPLAMPRIDRQFQGRLPVPAGSERPARNEGGKGRSIRRNPWRSSTPSPEPGIPEDGASSLRNARLRFAAVRRGPLGSSDGSVFVGARPRRIQSEPGEAGLPGGGRVSHFVGPDGMNFAIASARPLPIPPRIFAEPR